MKLGDTEVVTVRKIERTIAELKRLKPLTLADKQVLMTEIMMLKCFKNALKEGERWVDDREKGEGK